MDSHWQPLRAAGVPHLQLMLLQVPTPYIWGLLLQVLKVLDGVLLGRSSSLSRLWLPPLERMVLPLPQLPVQVQVVWHH